MTKASPSLAFLCIQSLKLQLLQSEDPIPDLYELPSELLDGVVAHLPALALQNFQSHMPFHCWGDYESGDDCLINGRKRARNDVLGSSWKVLFKLRWPEFIDHVESPADWQQLYWEKHLQKCLRLLNVLCVAETSELLRTSKLQHLVLRWIRSEKHVEHLCKLLIQSRDTLTSLEFIHCKLSSNSISAICASLHENGIYTTGMQRFCIKTSSIELDPLAAPPAFVSFLMSVRTLHSLHFCDSNLDRHITRMVFSTLLDSSSNLSSLDLSENNISGWLSTFCWRSVVGSPSSGKSLRSLCKLNLRGNELNKYDAENLAHALFLMPGLESLNLSGNPIKDSGIRSLISYFKKNLNSCLADLDLENCELSSCGVIEFLDTLSMLEKPLKFLSVADNALGSEVAEAIVNAFTFSVESINISGIGLGPLGFLALGRKLEKGSKKLLSINISKNRGGLETARFLSKLIPLAPRLISVDASYNLMPPESLLMLCDSLRTAKGDLKRLDMTGNSCINQAAEHSTLLCEFQHNGEPIFVLPSSFASHVPYDDDP
ncbi:NLR family CARD domain-containing protein 3 isoform X2 [Capsella rubella]|uniref:NLR family CARD domain-containing protein 3 isoform X2 n=1 Tax=Capsella rubella TaxID=81985 RepID=UPI000CD5A263|nr:NLR family CARD domain-containing protein 3 isoform X2 [Capsella rubella]